MTLDTEQSAQISTPEPQSPAPAPEASTPSVDPFKEELSKAEQLDAAEDAELRKAYRRAKEQSPSEPEPEDEPKAVRDPKTGKFVSPLKEELKTEDDTAEAETPEPKAVKAEKTSDPKLAPKTEEAKKPAVEAPKHWSEKVRQEFAKLDPEAQQELAKEATEMRQHLSRYGRAVKEMEPVAKVLQEHKALFEQAGIAPDQGIAALLRAQAQLSDPNTARQTLLKIAEDFNIDLGGVSAEPEDAEWVDPNVSQLRNHISQLENRLAHYERHTATQMQEQQAAAATSFVEQFAQGKEDFEALADGIEARVRMYRAAYPDVPANEILAKAYEEERALNPATREKLIAEKLKEQAAKVEQARRAAALSVRSEPDPYSAASEDDMLRQAYRRGRAA